MSKTIHIDEEKQKIFHERMNALLSQYGIIQNRTLTSFKKEIANKISATDRTVSDYILGKNLCSPAALIAIADYFSTRTDKDGNVNIISVDYLLGRTDHTSLGNEYIHDVTGLSDKAIDKLRRIKELNKELMPVINAIICSKKFASFLEVFKNYTWNNTNNMPFDTTDATLKKAVLQLQMENILNDISESYKRRG